MSQPAFPSRYSVVRIVLGLAVLLVVLSNFRLARTLLKQDDVQPPRSSSRGVRIRQPPLLPYPVFVVGLPKVGTTSIHQMFQCSGIKSSHYCCCGSNRTHTHCNDVPSGMSMAMCMKDNFKANRSILEGCGSYDVYAQMDSEFGNSEC
jgi:hypothetical protein